jgi:hypothetical protein
MEFANAVTKKYRSKLSIWLVAVGKHWVDVLTVSGTKRALRTNMTAEKMNMIQKFQRHPAEDSDT